MNHGGTWSTAATSRTFTEGKARVPHPTRQTRPGMVGLLRPYPVRERTVGQWPLLLQERILQCDSDVGGCHWLKMLACPSTGLTIQCTLPSSRKVWGESSAPQGMLPVGTGYIGRVLQPCGVVGRRREYEKLAIRGPRCLYVPDCRIISDETERRKSCDGFSVPSFARSLKRQCACIWPCYDGTRQKYA